MGIWEGKIAPIGALTLAAVLMGAGVASAQTEPRTITLQSAGSNVKQGTTPAVVPSAVFTGVVKQVVDGRTVLVARDAPPASAVIAHKPDTEEVVPIRLYGVTTPTTVSQQAQQFLNQIVGKRVRIEVRQGTSESSRAVRSALVYVLPDTSGTTVTPQPLTQHKPPSVALVPTRTADASNTSPDMPQGPVQPNVPTASNIPVPPPSSGIHSDDCVNYAIVRQGLGGWDRANVPDNRPLSDAEKDAQKSKRGIWAK